VGIELLGSLRVDGDDVPLQRRDQVVLSALAVRPGEVLSADQLAEAMWAGSPPASWPKQIHGSVLRLRRALGSELIETTAAGYRLAVPENELDRGQFEELVARAGAFASDGELDRAAVAYDRALELWRGAPFDVLDGWSPARIEAARLEELRLAAEESVLDLRLASGQHREVVAAAEARVAEWPLREHRWAILATALYRCGRQADALRALKQARRTLVEQLGIEPSAELVALESAILDQDESLLPVPVPPTTSSVCPYKGLAAYDVADTESFYGRDDDVATCLDRLDRHPLLVVTGASGCGKSSLVRAGLIPELQRAGRKVAVFMPGTDPHAAMTGALAGIDDGSPVLVIDQFEELFTGVGDPSRAQSFCARLAAYAIGTAPVVVVVRADHLAALAVDATFARLAEHGIHLVTPLAGDALRAAIEGPAAGAGLRLEHGLVDLLVRDCEGASGALPLLSHALVETWHRRDGRVLTVEGYRATGEIRGAVARSADRLYESLPAEQRPKLRSLLLRLVSPSLDGEPVRSRVAVRALAGDADRERVLGLLVGARLVTTEQDSVELAHEALARAWPRLRSWLDEDATGQRILRHLSIAADGWDSLGRPTSELYRGARLEAALEWRTATAPDLTSLESAFLDASVAQAATEREELAERAREQALQNRRLRRALAGVGLLLVVALIGGFLALDQRRDAQRQRRTATARELAAASVANLGDDPERSILLALAAIDETRARDGTVLPEAEEALHRAVTASRVVVSVPGVGGLVDWSPGGDLFVTEGPEESGLIDLRDAGTGESVRSFHGHDPDVNDVGFSSDGAMLATSGDDGAVRIWDPTTGEELSRVTGTDGPVWSPTFSDDGSRVLAIWRPSWPHVVRIADVATGEVVNEFELPRGGGADLSPDGSRVVLDLRVLDVGTGEEIVVLEGDDDWADPYAFSPDGKWIVAPVVAADGGVSQVRIWDATTGARVMTLEAGNVADLDWSADGTRLATSSHEGTARVWQVDADSARELFRFSTQDISSAGGVAFSPDGSRLMVGDGAITAVKVFDLSVAGGREWANVPDGRPGLPGAASFTPDGRELVTSSEEAAAAFWDAETGRRTRLHDLGSVSARLQVSPDGALVAGTTWAGPEAPLAGLPIRLWDAETGADVASVFADRAGEQVFDLAWSPNRTHLAVVHGSWEQREVAIIDRDGVVVTSLRPSEVGAAVMSVSFSGDGRLLATAQIGLPRSDPDIEHVSIWDWARGDIVRTIDTRAGLVAFDPTGDRLASSRYLEGIVDVWDSQTGDHLATLTGNKGLVNDLAFSADGSRVASAGADSTARVWDSETGTRVLTLHDSAPLATVTFSPDGSKLGSVSDDGIARVWALDLDDLIPIAHDRLTRGFTDEECRQYLHLERCPT
jgi:WD40 repeat protein/DNA-binding SARP family transcriptional activator